MRVCSKELIFADHGLLQATPVGNAMVSVVCVLMLAHSLEAMPCPICPSPCHRLKLRSNLYYHWLFSIQAFCNRFIKVHVAKNDHVLHVEGADMEGCERRP